jgi:hypothetical protein
MTLKFSDRPGGSNDNYHHISANDSEISFAEPIAMSHPGNKSFRQEMFDVCFAMFDVTMSSQQNWK